MPLYLQPPPVTELPDQSSSSSAAVSPSGGGSIGPFIAVLVVVAVLCVIAGVIGRLCSGKTIMGFGEYDMERWAERRCSSCIDGHIPPPPPPPPEPPLRCSSGVSDAAIPDQGAAENGNVEEPQEPQQPTHSSSSAH